jgi:NitT/TauT family transport system substrate-binding protein
MRRRDFLRALTVAGTTGALSLRVTPAAGEAPPETTTIRLFRTPSICVAPQFVAEELLRSEGFTDVKYLTTEGGRGIEPLMASGEVQINISFAAPLIIRVDAGDPIVMLAGVHVGCFELFGTDRVRTIRDLKGKSVAVRDLGGSEHVFVASMAAYVGVNPQRDINWVIHPPEDAMKLLAEGKIDGYLGFPPAPQQMRERKIGHVVVDSSLDRPWSQYFCCFVTAHREFVRKYPVATKRATRALLKAANICAAEPERAARLMTDKGYTPRFDYAFQVMKSLPYDRWRSLDPEDTLRFYSVRLHEAGMIKSSPQKILAQGTDWRFLDELRKELKG